jgi:Flp pilus assembly protein TadD
MLKRSLALAVLVCLVAPGAPAQKKKKPKGADYEYEKAMLSMKYGLEEESLKYLKQALTMDPRHAPSYKLLGVIQFRKKDFAEAAAAFEKYLELKPDDSEARANLGYVDEALGQADKAEAEYKKAVALDGNANACFGLAKLYLAQKRLPEALEYARQRVAKDDNSAAAYNMLGVILNQMGKYAEAVTSLENALRLTPDDVNLSVNLGVAYINSKEFAKARELYERILPRIEDPALKEKIEGYLKLIKERSEEAGQEPKKQFGRPA